MCVHVLFFNTMQYNIKHYETIFFSPSLAIRGQNAEIRKPQKLPSPHLCYLAVVILLSLFNSRDICTTDTTSICCTAEES